MGSGAAGGLVFGLHDTLVDDAIVKSKVVEASVTLQGGRVQVE